MITGPRSNGGKLMPATQPATSATTRRPHGAPTRVAGAGDDDSTVVSSGAVVAILTIFVGETPEWKNEEAGLAQELVGTAGHDARGTVAPVVDVDLLVLQLLLVVLERRARGALLEQDVEGLLDVVGVEFLVEVEDVVVFVLGGLGGGVVGDDGDGNLLIDFEVVVLLPVVDQVEVVVSFEVVFFERVG